MSIKIMAQIWDSGPKNQGELLVLLALADFADDSGKCWPSMRRVAEKARIQERSATRIVRRLEASGYLETKIGGGRYGCNQYIINPDPPVTPTESHPDPECTETLTLSTLNPDPPVTQTIIEPPIEPSKKKDAKEILLSVLSEDAANDYVEHRRAKRAKLTPRAAELIVSALTGHPDPDACVRNSIMNGWTGVFPEKLKKDSKNGKSTGDEIASRAAERFAARQMDSRASTSSSQPLLSARQPPRRIRGGD